MLTYMTPAEAAAHPSRAIRHAAAELASAVRLAVREGVEVTLVAVADNRHSPVGRFRVGGREVVVRWADFEAGRRGHDVCSTEGELLLTADADMWDILVRYSRMVPAADPLAAVPEPVRELVGALWAEGAAGVDLGERADTVWLLGADGSRTWSVRRIGTKAAWLVRGSRADGGDWIIEGSPALVARLLRDAALRIAGTPKDDADEAEGETLEVRTGDGTVLVRGSARPAHLAALRAMMAPGRALVRVGADGEAVLDARPARFRPARAAPLPRLEIRSPGGEVLRTDPATGKSDILRSGRHLLQAWTDVSARCGAWLVDADGEVEVTALLAEMRRTADRYTARGVSDLRANAADLRRRAELAAA